MSNVFDGILSSQLIDTCVSGLTHVLMCLYLRQVVWSMRIQGIFCSVSHNEKLCKFGHLLIKFQIDQQNIYT